MGWNESLAKSATRSVWRWSLIWKDHLYAAKLLQTRIVSSDRFASSQAAAFSLLLK